MPSSTSSFRISEELRHRLEITARSVNKGKNWVLTRALEEYLDRHSQVGLRAEARRQSQLASKSQGKDEALWEKSAAEVWSE